MQAETIVRDRLKKYLVTFLLFSTCLPWVFPCSSFVLKNGTTILLGKNFDWTFDGGYLLRNARNTKKVAYCTHTGTPASWTSKYGSITFNQNGKEMPYGGMNEKGLVVEMLWLENTSFNISDDKAYLNELEWIQYQLDNFQSVDEVVASIEKLKIYPIKGKLHYILADAHGKSVIIEYLNGKPAVYEKQANQCQAITNKSVVSSEKYIDDIQGIPRKNTSDLYRYHLLENQIRKLQETSDFSEKTAFEMLKSVSIPKGEFKTVWSVVYNIESRSVSFFSHTHRKVKKINLDHIDFEKGISGININQDAEIVLDSKLTSFDEKTNAEMVTASLTHLGFDSEMCKEISQHQFDQKLTTQSYFSQHYFHFDIQIPMPEAGQRLIFAIMDSEENFAKKSAVTGGYLFGTTSIGTADKHIYGMKNGTYAMIALLDDNKNTQLDFDGNGKPIEKYDTFNAFHPRSMAEITFANTSSYFTKDNAAVIIAWR